VNEKFFDKGYSRLAFWICLFIGSLSLLLVNMTAGCLRPDTIEYPYSSCEKIIDFDVEPYGVCKVVLEERAISYTGGSCNKLETGKYFCCYSSYTQSKFFGNDLCYVEEDLE